MPGTLPRFIRGGAALLAAATLCPLAAGQFTTYEDRTSLGINDAAITPDGRYLVARDNGAGTETYVVDLASGQRVARFMAGSASIAEGPANDAVVVSNSRAVTIGSEVSVIDLTTPLPTLISSIRAGLRPRDLAMDAMEQRVIVRGGDGTYVIELATGTVELFSPSAIQGVAELGNDMAAASADHGVTLSYDPSTDTTGILVVEFDPASGGGPRVVLDTSVTQPLANRPMDLAISPDGQYVTVRSEDELAVVRLDGGNTAVERTFNSFNGTVVPFGDTAFDTVVSNNEVWASFTINDGSTSDGSLNIQDLASGFTWFAFLSGTPRDLEITPDGNTLLVHTGTRIYEFDLASLPVGFAGLPNTNNRPVVATHSGLLAGLDSVVCTNTHAAVISPDSGSTNIRVYDLTTDTRPERIFGTTIPGWPVDVDISKDGNWIVAASINHSLVFDVRTLEVRLSEPANVGGDFTWCDGVVVHPDHAATFGVGGFNSNQGWLRAHDLVSRETLSCRSNPNSTGAIGELFVLGSTRASENDLGLRARFLPPSSVGLFILGDASQLTPLGAGNACVAGNLFRAPVQVTDADGAVAFDLDTGAFPVVGGGFIAGSTWFAQFVHRDTPAAGGFNFSNASQLEFH